MGEGTRPAEQTKEPHSRKRRRNILPRYVSSREWLERLDHEELSERGEAVLRQIIEDFRNLPGNPIQLSRKEAIGLVLDHANEGLHWLGMDLNDVLAFAHSGGEGKTSTEILLDFIENEVATRLEVLRQITLEFVAKARLSLKRPERWDGAEAKETTEVRKPLPDNKAGRKPRT